QPSSHTVTLSLHAALPISHVGFDHPRSGWHGGVATARRARRAAPSESPSLRQICEAPRKGRFAYLAEGGCGENPERGFDHPRSGWHRGAAAPRPTRAPPPATIATGEYRSADAQSERPGPHMAMAPPACLGTRVDRYRCCLPALAGFSTERREGRTGPPLKTPATRCVAGMRILAGFATMPGAGALARRTVAALAPLRSALAAAAQFDDGFAVALAESEHVRQAQGHRRLDHVRLRAGVLGRATVGRAADQRRLECPLANRVLEQLREARLVRPGLAWAGLVHAPPHL